MVSLMDCLAKAVILDAFKTGQVQTEEAPLSGSPEMPQIGLPGGCQAEVEKDSESGKVDRSGAVPHFLVPHP